MVDKNWYLDYLNRYQTALLETDVYEQCSSLCEIALKVKATGNKFMIAGNGASAAIASHVAADMTKQASVPSMTFHDADLITMMANDHGFTHWVAKSIEAFQQPGDAVILISSSGTSANMINAANTALDLGLHLTTVVGFNSEGVLGRMGNISFSLNSRAYNVIENIHCIWLTTVVDMLVGTAEYSVASRSKTESENAE